MATVRMIKGTKCADIYDSPEMIEGAKADGYVLLTEQKKVVETDSDEVKETPVKQSKRTARQ